MILRLVCPKKNVCSDYSQCLILKRQIDPLCINGLENFIMESTHFKMKNIREDLFQQSLRVMSLVFAKCIKDDKRCTYQMVYNTLEFGSATAYKILHDALEMNKIVSRWVPHHFTQQKIRACKTSRQTLAVTV
ncbi:hypothetical protein EVAR_83400_1 [Eumeta japonica]|uniref:Uncharacterized protein n=1 Tax=Eumeta variegata TaxID=151549 RepID=A0A4C1TYJ3_EUMVA|nr:hypothetical protein EVAR_83400_1 [Eumeta japonica]